MKVKVLKVCPESICAGLLEYFRTELGKKMSVFIYCTIRIPLIVLQLLSQASSRELTLKPLIEYSLYISAAA